MGKMLFTASQWREFESQTMIYKYIMASIPIPPQLLFPLSVQSNRSGSGTEVRFSNGSDPEPWRCRRTDGKKWRCSKDAMPDQKYCDRHAHKNRPRSRKLVETSAKLPSCPFRAATMITILPFPLLPVHEEWQHPFVFIKPKDSETNVFTKCRVKKGPLLYQDDCSLTLSMQSGGSGNGLYEEDQDLFQMGIGGMLNANGLNPPSQW
ncbi:hypothetical protein OSB04_010311 [Centaurea solstitialis]|uniref:Growth-regulating factor n=1 Tax=Centaurea solstitialis TaxID=347529 RepID=A0AA38WBT9_9ASTR|nr:hypothetical protein OSB04_010311 [Centaurea solstitialis]